MVYTQHGRLEYLLESFLNIVWFMFDQIDGQVRLFSESKKTTEIMHISKNQKRKKNSVVIF